MNNSKNKIFFLEETLDDENEVETLLNLVFTPQRKQLSSYYFRQGVSAIRKLCRVIKDEHGSIIGSIRYWPIHLTNRKLNCLLLGPLAVHPICQGEGIGAILILNTIKLAEEIGWERIILIGDKDYYCRFGFDKKYTTNIIFPQPVDKNRLLGRELLSGSMNGLSGPVLRFE